MRARPVLPSALGEKSPKKSADKSQPSDPLDALPAPDYAELEAQARAQLAAETSPPVSVSLLQGKSHRLVKQRMREMLTPGGELRSNSEQVSFGAQSKPS